MANNVTRQRFEDNEKMIRDKNVRAEQAVKKYFRADLTVVATPIEFLCECSNLECAEKIVISINGYEKIHRQKDHFIVHKGHEIPDVEKIVSKRTAFNVVEKTTM